MFERWKQIHVSLVFGTFAVAVIPGVTLSERIVSFSERS